MLLLLFCFIFILGGRSMFMPFQVCPCFDPVDLMSFFWTEMDTVFTFRIFTSFAEHLINTTYLCFHWDFDLDTIGPPTLLTTSFEIKASDIRSVSLSRCCVSQRLLWNAVGWSFCHHFSEALPTCKSLIFGSARTYARTHTDCWKWLYFEFQKVWASDNR